MLTEYKNPQLYGFLTTGVAIIFSGTVGGLVDRYNTHRLRTIRFFIFSQKLFSVLTYVLFYILFVDDTLRLAAENGGRGPNSEDPTKANVWSIFAAITFLGCFLILANVGVSVGIERDWVSSISQGSTRRLTRLNAIMRRIDLLSKLLAPLFVSLLTSVTGYTNSCIILLALNAGSTFFELYFIGIVYRRFDVLVEEETQHRLDRQEKQRVEQQQAGQNSNDSSYPPRTGLAPGRRIVIDSRHALFTWLREQHDNWRMFIAMPVFISEPCPIGLLPLLHCMLTFSCRLRLDLAPLHVSPLL
jgi:iron-regulated transporter 1